MENKKDFIVKFRGTRGSYPVAKASHLKFGGNTACVEVKCGDQLIILDAGTGIVDIGSDEIKNRIISQNFSQAHHASIILSHIHQDHIQGLQFYKPLFTTDSNINLFGLNAGNGSLKDTLKEILFDKVFPLGLDEIKSNFSINNLSQNDTVIIKQDGSTTIYDNSCCDLIFEQDDIKITTYKTPAHPKNGCLCVKIQYHNKSLVYATDKESYVGGDKRFILFARNCDCLIHDAQYTYQDYIDPLYPKQGFGHSTFEMAIEAAKYTKAKKLFFFHYDPDYDDEKLKILEKKYSGENIFFAKENHEFSL